MLLQITKRDERNLFGELAIDVISMTHLGTKKIEERLNLISLSLHHIFNVRNTAEFQGQVVLKNIFEQYFSPTSHAVNAKRFSKGT